MNAKFVALASSLVLLTSCASKFTRLEGNPKPVRDWKKAALVEVLVAPPQTPVFPLVDAAIYSVSQDKVAPQINEIHAGLIDTLTDEMEAALAKGSALELIAGKKLAGLEAYRGSGVESKPLETSSTKYPVLHATPGAINLFDVKGKPFTDAHLDESKPAAEDLSKLATALQVDGLVIGIVSAPTLGVGMFGLSGNRVSRVSLYFFDAQGKYLLKAYGQTDPSSGGPAKLDHYEKVIGMASPLTYEIAKTVFPGASKKSK
jgi:hypothetical protein